MEFRILELPGSITTRYCGRLFAQFGAEVVQAGDAPDDTATGYGGEAGRAYGRWLDAGKTRVPTGELEGRFDLVICWDGSQPPPAARDAVELHLSWFGSEGPYADWPATDEIIMALAGMAYSFGEADGPPVIAQGHTPQILAGATGCNAALAALLELPACRPRRVEINVFESTMCLSEVATVAAIADDRARSTRLGVNRFSPTYPCTSYRTSDGWAGVTCLTPAQWTALCEAIGRPEVAAEHRYSTAFRRLMRGDEVDDVLAPAFAQRSTAEWLEVGTKSRIPITPMPRPSELPHQEQWKARGSFAPLDSIEPRDGSGTIQAPTVPFQAAVTDNPTPRWEPGETPGPLSGVRIVDFSMGWSGPQATRFLADLGADVVKVESIEHPDWYRGWEARVEADPPPIEVRSNFNTLNRNKRGVVLELGEPDDLRIAKELIARADVVIDNFAAGVLDKLGLSHAVQRDLQPHVVSVSMPAFGSTGPLAPVRAYGSTVEQASGLPFVNGRDDWAPCLQHVAFGDPIAGVFAATAVLVALAGRATQGGASVDLSQVECLFQVGADAIIAEQLGGGPLPRTASERSRLALCAVIPSAGTDNWIAVAHPTLEWSDLEHRALTTSELAAAELRDRGIPAAPVQPAHALGDDPHLVATGFWETMHRRYVGDHPLGAPSFRFDGARPVARCPAPTLGEHTALVLGENA